jgi:hypothetical protein
MKSILLSVIMVIITATGCASFERGPFSGRVIDLETREPIEGAVILVVWQKAIYLSPGGPSTYFEEAKEALTDKEGKYHIDKYYGFTINPLAEMRDPEFLIFKPGYCVFPKGFGMASCNAMKPKDEYYDAFVKGGIIFELPKLKTREERLKNLPGSSDPFRDHYNKKRNYMRLLSIESKELGLQPETEPTE